MGLGEKKQAVMQYNSQGLRLDIALSIAGLSKAQYYHQSKGGKPGNRVSTHTSFHTASSVVEHTNEAVIEKIKTFHQDPDLSYGYRTMCKALQQQGYHINHKKVYRLMKAHQLLKDKKKTTPKKYVKYRRIQPVRPLEVLEMDIKMTWIETVHRQAYILNILDTFNRKWLYQCASFSITQHQVKQAWEHIIEQHLQPADLLKKQLQLEIRNDNDKRFSAQMVQDFFKENYLNQVFTHPYTPQENGHVESFHSILGKHLKPYTFHSLSELEQNLILFQEKYNNKRLHGSIAHLCPNDFDLLWKKGLITQYSKINKRQNVFKLNIPANQVYQHTGNIEPEGSFSHDSDPLNRPKKPKKEVNGAKTSNNLRYKKSPSVVSRTAKINQKKTIFENPKC